MIRTATTSRLPRGASSSTTFVALFALAVLQLGLALHHDQHSATELTGVCAACVQLEQFDDLVPATGTELVTWPDAAVSDAAVVRVPTGTRPRPYNSRAPPRHS